MAKLLKAWRSESGASAVEFALLLPVLITLLFGAIDLGWVINSQIQISNVANLGARNMASQGDVAAMKSLVSAQASSLGVSVPTANVSVSPSTCVAGEITTVFVTLTPQSITGWFSYGFDLSAAAAYVCEVDTPTP